MPSISQEPPAVNPESTPSVRHTWPLWSIPLAVVDVLLALAALPILRFASRPYDPLALLLAVAAVAFSWVVWHRSRRFGGVLALTTSAILALLVVVCWHY